jgi:hypothetical protein
MNKERSNSPERHIKRIGNLPGLLIALLITAALIYGLFPYINHNSPYFWIAAFLEVIFSITIFLPSSYIIRFVLVIVALVLPLALAAAFPFLWPIRGAPFVLLIASLWVIVFRKIRQVKPGKSQTHIPDSFVTPAYIPANFIETNVSRYRKQGHELIELVYSSNLNEHILWIKESQGPVSESKAKKDIHLFNKVIKGIPINIEQEIAKQHKNRTSGIEPLFTEANWVFKDLNYNLRTDGLSMDEVEKVIFSMID